jgi:hypothetical protein
VPVALLSPVPLAVLNVVVVLYAVTVLNDVVVFLLVAVDLLSAVPLAVLNVVVVLLLVLNVVVVL